METIVCLFNSQVYSFIFRKKFHSRKVLKSHLQALPLPFLSEERHESLYSIHSALVSGQISVSAGQAEIDALLLRLFNISRTEYTIILEN